MEYRGSEFKNDAHIRPPTPEPEHPVASTSSLPTPSPTQPNQPPPMNPSVFIDLDRVEQLRLIRPHLQLILSEAYPPAQWRIDKFFGSAQDRSALSHVVRYGDISDAEVDEVLVPELLRWSLRGERWTRNEVNRRNRPPEPPRPKGSERYNALPLSEIRNFVCDVLLPETIIELCIRSIEKESLLDALKKQKKPIDIDDEYIEEDMRALSDISSLSSDTDSEDENTPTHEEPAKQRSFSQETIISAAASKPAAESEVQASMADTGPQLTPPASSSFSSELLLGTQQPSLDTDALLNTSLQGDPSSSAQFIPEAVSEEQLLYCGALQYLSDLSNSSTTNVWETEEARFKYYRREMRKKLNLPEEGLSKEERKKWEEERAFNELKDLMMGKKFQRKRMTKTSSFADMDSD